MSGRRVIAWHRVPASNPFRLAGILGLKIEVERVVA
jgi:hypothetical protein